MHAKPSAHEGQLDIAMSTDSIEYNAHAGSHRNGCAAREVQDHT